VTTRFDRDTAALPRGDGRFAVRIDPGWWVAAGPNGGYVAAVLLRALGAAVDDPERAPRSLSIHYSAPPAAGDAVVETRVERTGRSLSTLSARLLQGERLLALALAAFSKPREQAIALDELEVPEVPPPERCPAMPHRIAIHERYEQRWAIGPQPFSGGRTALAGGWIRLAEPRAVDAVLAAAFSDAFPPAIFSTLAGRELTRGVPTVDLTIHFRRTLPLPGARPEDFVLAVFRSRLAREGFIEEDGRLFARDGQLLAQSRQLALLR
jgi:acyl-CoA thioesterase